MRRPNRRVALAALVAAWLLAPASHAAPPATPASQTAPSLVPAASAPPHREADLGDGVIARLTGPHLSLHVAIRPGEGWRSACARATGTPSGWRSLATSCGALTGQVQECEVPDSAWPPGTGARLLLALFPGDSADETGFHHRVTQGATPWTLAVLFIGDGHRSSALQRDAGSEGPLRVGEAVTIAASDLRPILRLHADATAAPAKPAPSTTTVADGTEPVVTGPAPLASEAPDGPAEDPDGRAPGAEERGADAPTDAGPPSADDAFAVKPGTRSDDGKLAYGSDERGAFAIYRLAKGETLYTDVVLKFTPLLSGHDVNEAASRWAERSGIRDVTGIPVGTAIRIPLSDLLPQELPAGHPRREALEREREASQRLARREKRKNLAGVHVIVDAGHGGTDPGAGSREVWEDDHVYDIACRVLAGLEERTRAEGHPLVRDRSTGEAPLARILRDEDEDLLSSPPFPLDRGAPTRVAVNLRWLMANDLRRQLAREGVSDDRLVFLSFHADSLHESATGAMAYFASARLRLPSCGVPDAPELDGIAESDPRNAFSMSSREELRAEGLSRDLGEAVVASLRAAHVPVHGISPVRGSIQRGGLMVPAVLRYNRIPAAVLVEACNLNNPDDRHRLRDPVWRQAFADAVVDGLVDYFEGRKAPEGVADDDDADGAGSAARTQLPRGGRSR